jgi:hypothetical protein
LGKKARAEGESSASMALEAVMGNALVRKKGVVCVWKAQNRLKITFEELKIAVVVVFIV